LQIADHRKWSLGKVKIGAVRRHETQIDQDAVPICQAAPLIRSDQRRDDTVACAYVLLRHEHAQIFRLDLACDNHGQITVLGHRYAIRQSHGFRDNARFDLGDDTLFPCQPLHLPNAEPDQNGSATQSDDGKEGSTAHEDPLGQRKTRRPVRPARLF